MTSAEEKTSWKEFFANKIASPTSNYGNLTSDAFSCLLQFFILINENEQYIYITPAVETNRYSSYTSYSNVSGPGFTQYSFSKPKDESDHLPDIRVKVHPEKLIGIGMFWRIVEEAKELDVITKSRDMLNKLYTSLAPEMEPNAPAIRKDFIEGYLTKLAGLIESKEEDRNERLGRMIRLMRDMIDQSEKKGTGGLKSHSALLKGEIITLEIKNNLTFSQHVPKKLDIEVYNNTTIWDLKAELGKFIESSADCMKFLIGRKELKDMDNGKTIGEFILRRRGVITVDKKNMDDIPKVPLLEKDQQLTARAKQVFTEIFNKFAKEGKMNNVAAASFIQNTTAEPSVQPVK